MSDTPFPAPALPALPRAVIEPIVRRALEEDLGLGGDLTAQACIAEHARGAALFVARRQGRMAGWDAARLAAELTDPHLRLDVLAPDGAEVEPGLTLARIEGPARAILTAERTMLNFLIRLSGVATLTRRFVERVEGTGARIADTRKTTPGLRALEKHAVRAGGGSPHRLRLDDAIMIKDNHVAACGGVLAAIERARAYAGHTVKIEVEIDRLDQLEDALEGRADIIMLDNFSLEDMRAAVARIAGRAIVEASGGVTLETVRAIAETGVDVISSGALTHSAPALDIGLDWT